MSICLSVCPFVCHRNPSASQNPVYLLLSLSLDLSDIWSLRSLISDPIINSSECLLTIMPINHCAYWPLCLSTIMPIDHLPLSAIWPSCLSAFWSSFATFKPFGFLFIFWSLWGKKKTNTNLHFRKLSYIFTGKLVYCVLV